MYGLQSPEHLRYVECSRSMLGSDANTLGLGSQDTFSVITSQEQLMLELVKTILIVIVQLWTLTHRELLGKGANIESVYLVILINSSHSPFSAPMRNFW